jgi:hypothetical protein
LPVFLRVKSLGLTGVKVLKKDLINKGNRIIMQEIGNLRKGMNLEAATDLAGVGNGGVTSLLKRVGLWGALLLFTFLLGFVPVWLASRETARQRDAAQAHLRLSQLQNRLATAATNARRGNYEPARIAASDFFTDLRAETDHQKSGFNARQLEAVKSMLAERDEVVTLLARSDQAAAERLTDMYLGYVQAMNAPLQKPESKLLQSVEMRAEE